MAVAITEDAAVVRWQVLSVSTEHGRHAVRQTYRHNESFGIDVIIQMLYSTAHAPCTGPAISTWKTTPHACMAVLLWSGYMQKGNV